MWSGCSKAVISSQSDCYCAEVGLGRMEFPHSQMLVVDILA